MYFSWVAQFTPRVAHDAKEEEAPRLKIPWALPSGLHSMAGSLVSSGSCPESCSSSPHSRGEAGEGFWGPWAIEFVPCMCPPQSNARPGWPEALRSRSQHRRSTGCVLPPHFRWCGFAAWIINLAGPPVWAVLWKMSFRWTKTANKAGHEAKKVAGLHFF